MNDIKEMIERWKVTPFEWGESDCVRFAAEAVFVICGIRAIAEDEFRFYSADQFQKEFPGDLIEEVIRERLSKVGFTRGERSAGPAIAIVPMGKKASALAVWDGGSLWVPGPMGIVDIIPNVASEWWQKLDQ